MDSSTHARMAPSLLQHPWGMRTLLQELLTTGWVPWDPSPFAPLRCAAVWEPSIPAGTCCDSRIHPPLQGYKSFPNIKARKGIQHQDR